MSDEGWWTFSAGDRPAPQRARMPWFDDMIKAMANAPTRLAGVVRARVADNGGTEFSYRVVRDGRRVRCSALDGAVHLIIGADTVWTRNGADHLVTGAIRPTVNYAPDDYEFGVLPFEWDRWEGDDFTQPVGGPVEVSLLGRAGWLITLAPPPHKPEPMRMIVDQQTFLVLHEGNAAFKTYHEWIALDLDPLIDDEIFAWQDSDRLAAHFQ